MRRAVLLQIKLQLAPIDTSLATGRGKYVCRQLGQHGYACVISHTLLYLMKAARRKIFWHAAENNQDATVDFFIEKKLLPADDMFDTALARDYARIFDVIPCPDLEWDIVLSGAISRSCLQVVDRMIKLSLTNIWRVKEVAIFWSSSRILQYVIDNGIDITLADIAEAERVNCTDHVINMLRAVVEK
jgi:hypothetical protein